MSSIAERLLAFGTLRFARLDRHEIAGSLGDMGTFLPLLVAMAEQNGIDFAAALFFAGVFNIVTGLTFAIPMAVQPMKAIAAVALAERLSAAQILAAGIIVSSIVLVLGLTGLIDRVDRAIPRSVTRGLQLALGLTLLIKGLQMIAGTGSWWAPDSYATGVCAALIAIMFLGSRRVPGALLLFLIGCVVAFMESPSAASFGFWTPSFTSLSASDFVVAFPQAALPQIPLTILNSVIAVCALSGDLFPDKRAAPRRVAVSVGLMNLVAGWCGGMPMCHGAGGLAGQVRFGAKTNGSILFLGAVKMTLALGLGASLIGLCRSFPESILGVMLAVSGIELAAVVRDQTDKDAIFVTLLTAGVCLGLNAIALGFGIGLLAAWLLRLQRASTCRYPW